MSRPKSRGDCSASLMAIETTLAISDTRDEIAADGDCRRSCPLHTRPPMATN